MAQSVRTRLRGSRLLLGTALAGLVLGLLPAAATHASTRTATVPAEAAAGDDVLANLWSWNWKSVAAECTDRVKAAFQGDIAQLEHLGPGQGLLPPQNSVAFVTNHDTERNGRHLTYKDGDTAVLANVFQLGWTEAPPTVYAGFAFAGNDDSPPADAGGFVTGTDCGAGWYCLDRDPRITGMVGWRNAAGGAEVSDWQSPRGNVVGFGRGDRGFVALNNTGEQVRQDFGTAVADGTYCNVLDDCATKVTVAGGRVALDLPARGAVAFHP